MIISLEVNSQRINYAYKNKGTTFVTGTILARRLIIICAVAHTKSTSPTQLHGKEGH
jgi:hypothetical protein